jgi:hypothetical protein
MTDETQKKLELLEALIQQKRTIEAKIEELLNPPVISESFYQSFRLSPSPAIETMPPQVHLSLHAKVLQALALQPDGMTTEDVFHALRKQFPDTNASQQETTASLVYLTHKRHKTERLGHGRYRLKC